LSKLFVSILRAFATLIKLVDLTSDSARHVDVLLLIA